MTSRFHQRWIVAGVIWLMVMSVSYLNFSKIKTITKVRESNERLHKEYLFQHRNTEKLLHIGHLHRTYYKPVASVNLGFESIRSSMHALATRFAMKNVMINHQISQAAVHGQIPFSVKMAGNHQNAIAFVSTLSKYPYLSITHSRISVINQKGDSEIDMELKFQFKIVSPEENNRPSLHASTLQLEQRVQRQ